MKLINAGKAVTEELIEMVSAVFLRYRCVRPLTLILPRTGKTVHKFPPVSLRTDLPKPTHKIKGRRYARLGRNDPSQTRIRFAPDPEGR